MKATYSVNNNDWNVIAVYHEMLILDRVTQKQYQRMGLKITTDEYNTYICNKWSLNTVQHIKQ